MTYTTLVRQTVSNVINRLLAESGRNVREFEDGDLLTRDTGLDSLDLATAVVQLEEQLGVDPFREGARPVRTFGEFVRVYEQSLGE